MRLFTILCAIGISVPVFSQINIRTVDGSMNNIINSEWGSTLTPLEREFTVGYNDGISLPGGINRPNPREISNVLFDQNSIIMNELNLSDFWWQWGQFIDHDITLIHNDPSEFYPIEVPMGDPYFDPFSTGNVLIPLHRAEADPTSGTSLSNPRTHLNNISTWIDGSAVYGSDLTRMNWLRTFVDGKLKMSSGDFLPYNTVTGELGDAIDLSAPAMANENPFVSKYFVAGDVRANEQTGLLAMHTLFAREHNRLCEEIKNAHPNYDDEEIFQKARKILGGIMQQITFEEWLPACGIDLMPYAGYDININPALTAVFSASAYRLGHTMINSHLIRLDNNGDTLPEGSLELKTAFFNPAILVNEGGLEPVFKGMASQPQQMVDDKMVSDLRNFLFGPPGSGGLDLAALNIQRGREMGIPDFNTIRIELGLDPLTEFSQISSNSDLNAELEDLYGDINELDAWVLMLAEDHMNNKAFGECINAILYEQFTKLRDGDRFYFDWDPAITPAEKLEIKGTTLSDVIRRNSSIENLQNESFFAQDHMECTLSENYGCTGCYEGGMPKPNGLQVQYLTDKIKLSWNAVPGSNHCQLNGGKINGNQVTLNKYGNEPKQRKVPYSKLQPGKTYQWRVKCFCEESGNNFDGGWSEYSYFIFNPPPLTEGDDQVHFAQKSLEKDIVNVFPNPFADYTNFYFDEELVNKKGTLVIFNKMGQIIFEQRISAQNLEFNKGGLPSGIYLYHVYAENSDRLMIGKISVL